MDATTVSEIQAIAEAARAQEDGARKLAERAERLLTLITKQAAQSPETADLKRADGRLTEAGVAAVNAAFEAGATVTEVSKQFGIHVSAASNRRTIWLAHKANSPKA
ncbi:hypothetical protein LPLAFNJD_LOCUS1850 [Methylorubrum aminovorans]